jgi:hypothetical protein
MTIHVHWPAGPLILLLLSSLPSWAWLSHGSSLLCGTRVHPFREKFATFSQPLQVLHMSMQGDSFEVNVGLNELQTLLREATQRQDFIEAGRLSDILASRLYGEDMKTVDETTRRARRRKMSWRGLGAAPWLVDRLDSINYTFPTSIQICSMEAVNAILNVTDVESTSLEERIGMENSNMGIVISGNTGSGRLSIDLQDRSMRSNFVSVSR